MLHLEDAEYERLKQLKSKMYGRTWQQFLLEPHRERVAQLFSEPQTKRRRGKERRNGGATK